MHVQRRAGELRFRLKRLSVQPHDLPRLIKRIAFDAHIDCIRSSQNLQQLPVKRGLFRKLLPIRTDFDDPFGKEQIVCAAAAVKSARLLRIDFCQRYRTEDRSVSIIGRDRIAPLRRVRSDRFSIYIKIERWISTRKQRQRIAGSAHTIQIFRVRQRERRGAAGRACQAKRQRNVGIGIDPAVPDALPLGLRDPLRQRPCRLPVTLTIRQIANVDLYRRRNLWRRLHVFTLGFLPRRARGQET